MRQHERVTREHRHLPDELSEHRLGAVDACQPSLAARALHLHAVDLHHRSVLLVANHGGLHDFAERRFLRRRHEQTAQREEARVASDARRDVTTRALEREHGDGGTEEVGELVQKHEAVAQRRDGDGLQVVVLHRNVGWQSASVHRLVGRPSDTVRRAASHAVDFLA